MNDDELEQHLDHLSTCWTSFMQAHELMEEVEATQLARQRFLARYQKPIYRYVLAVVKSTDLADDIIQQFAVLVMEGRLHRASPERGKLRKYLKTVVLNLIRKHHRDNGKNAPLPDDVPAPASSEDDDVFSTHWRKNFVDQSLKELTGRHPTQGRLLRLRSASPTLTSAEMAERFAEEYNQPVTAANVRKALQRAHGTFGKILVDQVAASLDGPTAEDLASELEELDLLKYCRDSFDAWVSRQAT